MSDESSGGYDLAPEPPTPPHPQRMAHATAGPARPAVDLRKNDVTCLNCGYNLRGLSESGNCPECGTPVWRSLRGNLLIFSAPEYLAMLNRGLLCILIAVIAKFAFMIVGIGALALFRQDAMGLYLAITTTVPLGIGALSLVGWWMFSAPDPAIIGNEKGSGPRKAIRAAVIVSASCSVLALASQYAMRPTESAQIATGVAGVMEGIAWLVTFFASMMYISWLAPRIPSRDLDLQARRYMWMIPLIYVLGACVIVGPLVAAVLYYLMLNNIRITLQSIRQKQAREAAALAASSA